LCTVTDVCLGLEFLLAKLLLADELIESYEDSVDDVGDKS
jgi:hypothetical protein